MSVMTAPTGQVEKTPTANERFKQGFGDWFWASIAVATVVHFLIFAFFPSLRAEDVSWSREQLEAVELPPEVEIPPPPEQIARPATPVISEAQIDEDVTIAATTFEANPIENLPPPPTGENADLSAAPVFTPFTVAPELRNRDAVQRALVRHYPPLLRDAGIGGDVLVWFFIDETGKVRRYQIKESSGHEALDQAALKVADIMEFTPALNRDKKVPVWVSLPITFRAR